MAARETDRPGARAPDYLVRLRPARDASDPRGIRRLRWDLKVLLRRFRLRCIRIRQETDRP